MSVFRKKEREYEREGDQCVDQTMMRVRGREVVSEREGVGVGES